MVAEKIRELDGWQQVARVEALEQAGHLTVQAGEQTLALFLHEGSVHAIDNRCPHMGFPLDRGTLRDGILTCHWHHARFDLSSGGTFDLFADDVPAFPVELRDGEVWVDVRQNGDRQARQCERLAVGLERNLSLVIAKAVLLQDGQDDPAGPFRAGLEFGTRNRLDGWGQGLTMLTCMQNMLPQLDAEDRPRALYQGLAAVANEVSGEPPRFAIRPLPGAGSNIATLKVWLRQFIEVRDDEGAERCVISALKAGATRAQMANMLFAAVTDHRYIDVGHPADFTNKAFEALDHVGDEHAASALTSLVRGYAQARRMEEDNAWRYPIDLVALLEAAFEQLPAALATGRGKAWTGRGALARLLLDDDPAATLNAMVDALRAGATMVELASTVSYAAALRIGRFHTSNEFGDWDTALHSFTFANAIEQGLRRAPSVELLRGVLDAAMSVYLDRFLNIPAARIPQPNGATAPADETLAALPALLNNQQQVNQAGALVAQYFHAEGESAPMLAMLGRLLLREDRDFHTIQTVEAAMRQYRLLGPGAEGTHVLLAAARYLAAHSPTVRAQGQTWRVARRLHRGESLFEG